MTAKIAGLTRYPQKGAPGVAMSEMNLLKEIGIEGDFHRGSERQVSLLSAETRRWMEAQPQTGLCFGRFRENLLIEGSIEGLPLEQQKSGAFLSAGSAVLQIGAHGKHCYADCRLFLSGMPCRLSGGLCFAAVAQSGIVRVGDSVLLRTSPRV